MPRTRSFPAWVLLAVIAAAALLGPGAPDAGASWTHTHGDARNAGLADVVTAPAGLPSAKVTGIGTYAPGAGPVIAPDGTVYLGSIEGFLRAFTPTGQATWTRDTPRRRIVASPAVGADGSIYVVGTSMARDHRDGRDTVRYDATLYRFTSTAALPWLREFPTGSQGGPATTAPPTIWRLGETEVVMVPAIYRHLGSYNLHLLAFSTAGDVMFDQKVTAWTYAVTGSADWGEAFCRIWPLCINKLFGLEETEPVPDANQLPRDLEPPMPGVGLFQSGGALPTVVVADHHQNLVGYRFSPTEGFRETFRKHLTRDRLSMSPPVLLRDGHSMIRGNGTSQAWLLFGGPNAVNWTEVAVPLSGSTPTLTADGRIVTVDRAGGVTVVATTPARAVVNRLRLEAQSIAPAAASCTHVFVSTASAMVTLDAKAASRVVQFDWRGGGRSSPAIGPNGAVYALAGDALHVFPSPPPGRRPVAAAGSCLGQVVAPGRGGGGGGPVIR